MKKRYISPSVQQIPLMARTHMLTTSPDPFGLKGDRDDVLEVDEDEWEDG